MKIRLLIVLCVLLLFTGCKRLEYEPKKTNPIKETLIPVMSESQASKDVQILYSFDLKEGLYLPEPWPKDLNGKLFDRLDHYELLSDIEGDYIKTKEKLEEQLKAQGADLNGEKLFLFLEQQNIKVNNKTTLNLLLTNAYALEELQRYFGEYTKNEATVLRIKDESGFMSDHWLESQKHLYIGKVNEKYPIEVLRYTGYGKLYTVYQVKEGGYFMVFWEYSEWNNYFASSGSEFVIANGTVYFEKLPTLENYCEFIEIGTTTWKDLIDFQDIPYMDHNAGGNITWQPLKNGDVLSITFQLDLKNDHAAGTPYSKTDYIVNNITYYPTGTITTWMDSLLVSDREFVVTVRR